LAEVLLKIFKNHRRVMLPSYESEGASGMDLRAFLDSEVTIQPLCRAKIPTGLRLEIPFGYEAQVRPRSGMANNFGLTVLNSPGTIDSDYRGDVEIILVNLSKEDVIIKDGQRIAQLVIAPVCRARIALSDTLEESARGSGAFGSTGLF
jgi:dUTP pyrophosphatase